MARFIQSEKNQIGASPGALVYTGTHTTEPIRISLSSYNQAELVELEVSAFPALADLSPDRVTWINLDGLYDPLVLRQAGEAFGLHPMLLEDIMTVGQIPKVEEYENCLFIVTTMLRWDSKREELVSEHLSMVLGENYVLTFQEFPGDVFDPVRERMRKNRGRVRSMKADYLAFALMDTIMDNYLSIVEKIGIQIEDLEERVLTDTSRKVMETISDLKREMNYLRKIIRPAHEALVVLPRLENQFLGDETVMFYKDLADHSAQASLAVDAYRDMLTDHLTIFNALQNNRLNEIMRILTIFSAIFIPLTFISSIYGTNFEYMPEIRQPLGYPIFLGVLAVVAVTMIVFFKRKKWF